jgi:hypothetical protein
MIDEHIYTNVVAEREEPTVVKSVPVTQPRKLEPQTIVDDIASDIDELLKDL